MALHRKLYTRKDSGITNNTIDWSYLVGNPFYILDLLLPIISMSPGKPPNIVPVIIRSTSLIMEKQYEKDTI